MSGEIVYPFVHEPSPVRVLFGEGTIAQAEGELERLGIHRVLILCGEDQLAEAETVSTSFGTRQAHILASAVAHVPVEVAREAVETASAVSADGLLAIGGGSSIGLAKAVALETGLPVLALPTTYAGSEMTSIWGLTENGQKRTGREKKVRPSSVIYDVALTRSLPLGLSATSGLNAIAHCVEALYAPDGNPIIALQAEEGIAALADGLPRLSDADGDARAKCLYGAWLAGIALDSTSMGLHHKICHTLGGSWNLPHAETHAAMLPYTAAYNAAAAPQAMERVARALGANSAVEGLWNLGRQLEVPASLREIGLPEEAIAQTAAMAVANPYPNPCPVARDRVEAMLRFAWEGAPPMSFA
jgi:maleylacetate reductase